MNYLIIKDTDWPGEDRHTIEFWTGSKWTEMRHKAKSYTGDEARVESRKLEKYEDKYTLVTYMMDGFA